MAAPSEKSGLLPPDVAMDFYQQAMSTLTVILAAADLLAMNQQLDPSLQELKGLFRDLKDMSPEDYEKLKELAATVIDFWAENGLEHERCGEMIERIGLVNFLEGIGIDVDPNMITHPRISSYVRMDEWDQEAAKWFERKHQAAG